MEEKKHFEDFACYNGMPYLLSLNLKNKKTIRDVYSVGQDDIIVTKALIPFESQNHFYEVNEKNMKEASPNGKKRLGAAIRECCEVKLLKIPVSILII